MSPSKCTLFVTAFICLCVFALPLRAEQSADIATTLNSLEQTSRNAISDISHLRIEKWKTDSANKKSAQSDGDALQRNLDSALPELIGNVRNAPQNLNANFKLYRNLNVLYDVFSRFAESAGAFGSREDFEALARDLDGLDSARHALADRLETMTATAQSELEQYAARARAQAATEAAPPKKIVIDDSEPEKKKETTHKKKTTKPAEAKPATTPPADSSTGGSPQPK